MIAAESLILTGLIALVVGIGIGALIGRRGSSVKHQKDLETNLTNVKQELDAYQQEVAKHFMDTAKRVSDLTQNYRELNQHLAEGAMRLTSTEITQKMIAASENQMQKPLDLTGVEAPKDWAPKIPGRHGMLSEEFGLKEQEKDQEDKNAPPVAAEREDPNKNQG